MLQKMVSVVAVVAVGLVLSTPVLTYSLTDNAIQQNLLRLAQAGRPEARIIGGQRVTDRCQAPFSSMVALQIYSYDVRAPVTYCSAVMISPDVLVTAAICMTPYFDYPISELKIVLGEKHFDFQDRFQTTATLETYRIHPQYRNATGDNNIALIKLRTPATLNACVQPLQRYQRDVTTCTSALMSCTITGWGAFSPNGNLNRNSKFPLYGQIRLADEHLSTVVAGSASYPDVTMRQNSLLGFPQTSSVLQACFLDWGGMVACQVGGSWKLRGVIAEYNCDPPGTAAPMIISNVENFRSWIDACMSNFYSNSCGYLVMSYA